MTTPAQMFPAGTPQAELYDMSVRTTLGVVKARQTGRVDDAAMLLREHFLEATAKGHQPTTVWAMLFSGSAGLLMGQIEDNARARDLQPARVLEQISIAAQS